MTSGYEEEESVETLRLSFVNFPPLNFDSFNQKVTELVLRKENVIKSRK